MMKAVLSYLVPEAFMLNKNLIKQDGFTLIEALVALAILSIGLLGMAGMQTKAYLSANNAYISSITTIAAIDAQERLWLEVANDSEIIDCADLASRIDSGNKAKEMYALVDDWQTHWFYSSGAPLSKMNSKGNILVEEITECEFKVEIETKGDSKYYYIKLPNLSSLGL